jgi:hypothetical protein
MSDAVNLFKQNLVELRQYTAGDSFVMITPSYKPISRRRWLLSALPVKRTTVADFPDGISSQHVGRSFIYHHEAMIWFKVNFHIAIEQYDYSVFLGNNERYGEHLSGLALQAVANSELFGNLVLELV